VLVFVMLVVVVVFFSVHHRQGPAELNRRTAEQRDALLRRRVDRLRHGTKELATDFLNCGSPVLAGKAKRWAEARGMIIVYSARAATVQWARF
jgi:hypothetical protein